jgi:hypothetical protein
LGIRDVGVICTASIVYEICQRPAGRPNSLQALFDRLAPPLSVVFTLYNLWLVLAELEWVWAPGASIPYVLTVLWALAGAATSP